jgi:hypothetical protein
MEFRQARFANAVFHQNSAALPRTAEAAKGGTASDSEIVTATGKVVDAACYMVHASAATNASHKDCGVACLARGVPRCSRRRHAVLSLRWKSATQGSPERACPRLGNYRREVRPDGAQNAGWGQESNGGPGRGWLQTDHPSNACEGLTDTAPRRFVITKFVDHDRRKE